MDKATIDKSKVWNVKDYEQLEEGLLAQLIKGELIMSPAPVPQHQRILRNLFIQLDKSFNTGELYFSPIDLYLDNQNIYQPDLLFVSEDNKNIITGKAIEGAPDLIVEVISPSNSFIDRNTKKRKYLEFGVIEYWIVDPANKTLEIYTPEDHDTPRLYLVKAGQISSLVSQSIAFNLDEIW